MRQARRDRRPCRCGQQMRCGRQSVRDRQMNCDFSPRCDFLPRRGQWMHTTGDGCATSGKCTPRSSAALRFFAALRFPAVSRPADAPLHVKIMFSASLYHRCADRFANAPFRKGERPLSMRRLPAAKMRLSRGEYAIAPIGWPPPCRGTQRAENDGCRKRRSRSACGTFDERLRGARVDDRRTAGGYSQATRRRSRSEKRGSGERDGKQAVKNCARRSSLRRTAERGGDANRSTYSMCACARF